MKSAYERALERFGGEPVQALSDEQKAKLADVERVCKSRLAEAELKYHERLEQAADAAARERLASDYSVEIASIRHRAEQDREAIRAR